MSSLWNHDRKLIAEHGVLAGVDEAGRGPLAGPVVAAVVCLREDFFAQRGTKKASAGITDSKQLSQTRREELYKLLMAWREGGRLEFAIGEGSVAEIEQLNILGATRLAMQRALEQLSHDLPSDMPLFANGHAPQLRILVDGRPLKPFPYAHTALVKGDGKSLCIAAASIIAKVTRDRQMATMEAHYPGYGFAAHKGYGTPEHCAAIRRLGPTPLHRKLFLQRVLTAAEA
ncbi:MAG: ribonuclease HII [Verrucomicrobiota bacterium]